MAELDLDGDALEDWQRAGVRIIKAVLDIRSAI